MPTTPTSYYRDSPALKRGRKRQGILQRYTFRGILPGPWHWQRSAHSAKRGRKRCKVPHGRSCADVLILWHTAQSGHALCRMRGAVCRLPGGACARAPADEWRSPRCTRRASNRTQTAARSQSPQLRTLPGTCRRPHWCNTQHDRFAHKCIRMHADTRTARSAVRAPS